MRILNPNSTPEESHQWNFGFTIEAMCGELDVVVLPLVMSYSLCNKELGSI